jgi:hypothetical protein
MKEKKRGEQTDTGERTKPTNAEAMNQTKNTNNTGLCPKEEEERQ